MSRAPAEPSDTPFWSLTEALLADPTVTRGTMMGHPCVRANGTYFASLDPTTGHLVVKLPADRVGELIGAGEAIAFAPAGRTFREWAAIPDPDRWSGLLGEARAFVDQ